MPAAINEQTRKQVIHQWINDDTRDKIAVDNGIGEGTSTVNLPAEENDSKTNSGKADAQDGQKAVHPRANFTQKKAADTAIDQLKPSEPSASTEPKTVRSVEEFFRDGADLPCELLPEHKATKYYIEYLDFIGLYEVTFLYEEKKHYIPLLFKVTT